MPAAISSFLSEDARIDAEVLVVEGWLTEAALEEAVQEFRSHDYRLVLTTGVAVPSLLFMHSNSRLVIDAATPSGATLPVSSTVRIEAYGTPAQGVYPHMTVLVNDSVVGDQYVTRQTASYAFTVRNVRDIHTVAIAFDNDAKASGEDRNLSVTGLWLNQYRLDTLVGKVTTHYKRGGGELIETPSWTLAERSARTLRRLGLDSALVIPVPVAEAPLGRTYTSALNCRKWLASHDPQVKTINVFSHGIHTRRSHYLYEKAFGEQARVGIISASGWNQQSSSEWTKEEFKAVGREFGKYLYARFFQQDADE